MTHPFLHVTDILGLRLHCWANYANVKMRFGPFFYFYSVTYDFWPFQRSLRPSKYLGPNGSLTSSLVFNGLPPIEVIYLQRTQIPQRIHLCMFLSILDLRFIYKLYNFHRKCQDTKNKKWYEKKCFNTFIVNIKIIYPKIMSVLFAPLHILLA